MALITVLSLIALLTITLVAFFALVQDDRQRAREFLDYSQSTMLIESAFQEALGKIIEGSEEPWATSPDGEVVGASMTASPGLMEIRYYNENPNRGSGFGPGQWDDPNSFVRNPFAREYGGQPANPRWIPLFSWQRFAPGIPFFDSTGGSASRPNPDYNPAAIFNLNNIDNPFYPGELYLSGTPSESFAAKFANQGPHEQNNFATTNSNREEKFFQPGESSFDRPFYVQWIPVLANPFEEPSQDNPLVGRYAYWVDVENTKIHLNTNTRSLFDDRSGAGGNISTAASILGVPMGDAFSDLPLVFDTNHRDNLRTWGDLRNNREFVHFQQHTSLNAIFSSSWNQARFNILDGTPIPSVRGSFGWGVRNQYHSSNDNFSISIPSGESGYAVFSSGGAIELDSAPGNNFPQSRMFDLYMGWSPRLQEGETNWRGEHEAEDNLPIFADHSLIDWDVFTGKRPLYEGFGVSEMRLERLVQPYARANLEENDSFTTSGVGRFNSFTELWSLIDPEGQNETLPAPNPNISIGDAYLQSVRRTFGMSATIHGYEEERDPLGRPKIDIVALQNALTNSSDLDSGPGLVGEVLDRLRDRRYHQAYYPGRLRPYMSDDAQGRSFAQSMNAFAGDGNRNNDDNGLAVVRQILANIGGYAKSTLSDMATYADSFTGRNDGVWPALPIPYVMEVTTRGRNSLWLLAFDEDEGENQNPLNYRSPADSDESNVEDRDEVTVNQLFSGWDFKEDENESENPRRNTEQPDPDGPVLITGYTFFLELSYEEPDDAQHSILVPRVEETDESPDNGSVSLENFPPSISAAQNRVTFELEFEYDSPVPEDDEEDAPQWDDVLPSIQIDYYLDGGSDGRVSRFLQATNVNDSLPSDLGTDLTNYLQNIIVDMAFALGNPNPFFTNEKNWDLNYSFEFQNDYELNFWDNGNAVGTNDFNLSIPAGSENNYAMRPGGGTGTGEDMTERFSLLSHNVMARGDFLFATLRDEGNSTPYSPFNFGRWAEDFSDANPPELVGWEISHGANLLHKVPHNSLGVTSDPIDWWQMANHDRNVGFASMFDVGLLNVDNRYPWSPTIQWRESLKPFQERIHLGAGDQNQAESGWNERFWEGSFSSSDQLRTYGSVNPDDTIPVGWFSYPTFMARWDSDYLSGAGGTDYLSVIDWEERTSEENLGFFEKETINIFMGQAFLSAIGNIYDIPIMVRAHQGEDDEMPVRDEPASTEESDPETSFGFVLRNFLNNVSKGPPMVESVISIDPVLGHRTGNTSSSLRVTSNFGNLSSQDPRDGHFYGVLGHTWRRHSQQISAFNFVPSVETGDLEENLVRAYRTETRTETRSVRRPVVVGNSTIWIEEEIEVEISERVRDPENDSIEFALPVNENRARIIMPSIMATSLNTSSRFGRAPQEVAMGLNLLDYRAMYDPMNQSSSIDREIDGVLPIPYQGTSHRQSGGNLLSHRSIFSNAPRGALMVNIGELGFVHSGLMQMPIDLAGYTPAMPYFAVDSGTRAVSFPPVGSPNVRIESGRQLDAKHDIGFSMFAVGSPQNGPPMAMLLDLFTPGSFRNSLTGRANSRDDWENSGEGVDSNSPLNPRRGTWNVNIATAGDNYLAFTAGEPNEVNTGRGRTNIPSSTLHPVWVPSGMGMQYFKGRRNNQMLDPWMNYFPRFRRGFENLITTIGGDFTPDRSQGVGVWRDQFFVDRGNFYFGPLNLPVYSFVEIDDSIGAWFDNERRNFNARLPTAGHRILGDDDSLYSGHLNIDSLFSYQGNHRSGTVMDQGVTSHSDALIANEANHRMPLERITRFALYPMRHHISELNRSSLDSSEQFTPNKENNPGKRGAEFGFSYITTALNPARFFANHPNASSASGSDFSFQQILGAGPAGNEWSRGIFRNAPYAVSANQVSTSANVFTIHMVAQAIRDSGENDQDNGELNNWGDFSFSDEVLSEQWARAVVARVPSETTLSRYRADDFRDPEYEYKVLYYRVVDNPR
ncbi:MAG: hypothetical protein JJT75_07630 [Opitutales bacterium]|nr:hypothetical protein [Opitutales bacterium]